MTKTTTQTLGRYGLTGAALLNELRGRSINEPINFAQTGLQIINRVINIRDLATAHGRTAVVKACDQLQDLRYAYERAAALEALLLTDEGKATASSKAAEALLLAIFADITRLLASLGLDMTTCTPKAIREYIQQA